jgi:hypothetical protein
MVGCPETSESVPWGVQCTLSKTSITWRSWYGFRLPSVDDAIVVSCDVVNRVYGVCGMLLLLWFLLTHLANFPR